MNFIFLKGICISPSADIPFNIKYKEWSHSSSEPQYKNAFQIKYTSIAEEGPNGFGNCHWQQFILTLISNNSFMIRFPEKFGFLQEHFKILPLLISGGKPW